MTEGYLFMWWVAARREHGALVHDALCITIVDLKRLQCPRGRRGRGAGGEWEWCSQETMDGILLLLSFPPPSPYPVVSLSLLL